MVKTAISEVKMNEIDRLCDRWRESLIGRPKQDGKLNVFLLDAAAAMRAEGFSYSRMAKKLREVSRRTLLAWAAEGRRGGSETLEYRFWAIMENKPVSESTETKDESDPWAPLLRAKANREQVATQQTMVPLAEVGEVFYLVDEREDSADFVDPNKLVERWLSNSE